jgi:hypothetical protein
MEPLRTFSPTVEVTYGLHIAIRRGVGDQCSPPAIFLVSGRRPSRAVHPPL